jgi:hypothetical protein
MHRDERQQQLWRMGPGGDTVPGNHTDHAPSHHGDGFAARPHRYDNDDDGMLVYDVPDVVLPPREPPAEAVVAAVPPPPPRHRVAVGDRDRALQPWERRALDESHGGRAGDRWGGDSGGAVGAGQHRNAEPHVGSGSAAAGHRGDGAQRGARTDLPVRWAEDEPPSHHDARSADAYGDGGDGGSRAGAAGQVPSLDDVLALMGQQQQSQRDREAADIRGHYR